MPRAIGGRVARRLLPPARVKRARTRVAAVVVVVVVAAVGVSWFHRGAIAPRAPTLLD